MSEVNFSHARSLVFDPAQLTYPEPSIVVESSICDERTAYRLQRQARITKSERGQAMLRRALQAEHAAVDNVMDIISDVAQSPLVSTEALCLASRLGPNVYASPGFAGYDRIEEVVAVVVGGRGRRCDPGFEVMHAVVCCPSGGVISDRALLRLAVRRMHMMVPDLSQHDYLLAIHRDRAHPHVHIAIGRTDYSGAVVHLPGVDRCLRLVDLVEDRISGRTRDDFPMYAACSKNNQKMNRRQISRISMLWMEQQRLSWFVNFPSGDTDIVPVVDQAVWARIAPQAGPEAISICFGSDPAAEILPYVGRPRGGKPQ